MQERTPHAHGPLSTKLRSPEEEVSFLRDRVAEKERELLDRNHEIDATDHETLARQEIKEYSEFMPETVLDRKHQLSGHELASRTEEVKTSQDQVEDIVALARERGIRNALTVLEKIDSAFVTDEVHRQLVHDIRSGRKLGTVKKGTPLWQVLHMTLFEVALPEHDEEGNERSFGEIVSSMEQFYAGMQSIATDEKDNHYTLEIAVQDKRDEIVFYAAVPTEQIDLFEKQLLSIFPRAIITEQVHDYNIFVDGGVSHASVARLSEYPLYPLRLYDSFDYDPLNVLLNAFSKIETEGGGAAVQVVFKPRHKDYKGVYKRIIEQVTDGKKVKEAIRLSTFGGTIIETIKELFAPAKKERAHDEHDTPAEKEQETLELFREKIDRPIVATNIRVVSSAHTKERARQILSDVESSFNQLENTKGNRFVFDRLKGAALKRCLTSFTFRKYSKKHELPLSTAELTSLIHFPALGIESSPQFKQSRVRAAPAQGDLPKGGTLIGINEYRGAKKDIYVSDEDRLRHFYAIGQTGTGKTTLMKNMIAQDIERGSGVCFIDPHGTDIEDVLGAIPPERERDIIYFDPSSTERVMGLNMLEFDEAHPEQKTFVINELFSIFQKIYGANPEAMGPMFEQYFRNATALVLEDPESGNTLLDVSRVMSDREYRRKKLRAAKNPVVVQFWENIATKAGGEASLENIVPYITSKFDTFIANDYMRPIIGQQHSAFDFRKIMDEKKILLVNLSKGRLGEINANLIGMIVVGKILMAALSRVDDATKSYPPFYLYMDEFQNVTTESIASILSEARKYKLGLTVAHQFIAQLEENIRDAVFGNIGSIAAFRVGARDAEFLEKQFEPVFTAHDLLNVNNRHALTRILADGTPTRPFSLHTMPPAEVDLTKVARLKEASYKRYASYRAKVEMQIAARYH